jgi:ribosomal protein S18 acetylase RimI-like enzyme
MHLKDKAILSTWLEYLDSLKLNLPLADVSLKSDPQALSVITGVQQNLYNSVLIKSPENEAALIQELQNIQQSLQLPLTAWVSSLTQSSTVEMCLKQEFPSPGAFYGMLLPLHQAQITPCPKEITIEQITNQQQAEEYARLFSEVFNFPALLERTINWVIRQTRDLEPSGYSFIARINGELAGACTLMIDRRFKEFKTGGLYNACVLPKFRKYGIGTAMACQRVNKAKELGLEYLSILLMSDAMARGYCQRLGFIHSGIMTPYYI